MRLKSVFCAVAAAAALSGCSSDREPYAPYPPYVPCGPVTDEQVKAMPAQPIQNVYGSRWRIVLSADSPWQCLQQARTLYSTRGVGPVLSGEGDACAYGKAVCLGKSSSGDDAEVLLIVSEGKACVPDKKALTEYRMRD